MSKESLRQLWFPYSDHETEIPFLRDHFLKGGNFLQLTSPQTEFLINLCSISCPCFIFFGILGRIHFALGMQWVNWISSQAEQLVRNNEFGLVPWYWGWRGCSPPPSQRCPEEYSHSWCLPQTISSVLEKKSLFQPKWWHKVIKAFFCCSLDVTGACPMFFEPAKAFPAGRH